MFWGNPWHLASGAMVHDAAYGRASNKILRTTKKLLDLKGNAAMKIDGYCHCGKIAYEEGGIIFLFRFIALVVVSGALLQLCCAPQ